MFLIQDIIETKEGKLCRLEIVEVGKSKYQVKVLEDQSTNSGTLHYISIEYINKYFKKVK